MQFLVALVVACLWHAGQGCFIKCGGASCSMNSTGCTPECYCDAFGNAICRCTAGSMPNHDPSGRAPLIINASALTDPSGSAASIINASAFMGEASALMEEVRSAVVHI